MVAGVDALASPDLNTGCWCGREELNLHEHVSSTDFKSVASTDSATSAHTGDDV